jgi:OmpA-OmpF porin, OOP family
MKNLAIFLAVFLSVLSFLPEVITAEQDEAGCKDYPMFTRMPNFYISECRQKDFEAYPFIIGETADADHKTKTVEGKYFFIQYNLREDRPEASYLQIIRNYSNAVKKAGGKTVAEKIEANSSYNYYTATFSKEGRNIWMSIPEVGQDSYQLVVVEQEAMKQEVSAKDMLTALNKDGFIALHINFDTGKSSVKPDSVPVVDQIYAMLKDNPKLKISIEGHTDNVGKPSDNKKLSEARAKAVQDALVAKGIDKNRLSFAGFGQDVPVADNRTEEGRAKNRRVELVKK